jgi:hypothetical protein
MEIKNVALILLVLGMLVPGAVALDPSQIEITSDHDWITAGTGVGTDETATITVQITNGSVTVNEVAFSCDDVFIVDENENTIGELSPLQDATSPFTATFHSKKSGEAAINVTVKYTEELDGDVLQMRKAFVQKVDHALPYAFAYLDYETEITVDTTTPIAIQMIDKYGNVVDSRKEDTLGIDAEGVRFQCSSGTDAGFWNGVDYTTNDIIKRVDSGGNLSATFKASTSAGENMVDLICVTAVPEMLISIYGVGETKPESMTTAVDPVGLRVPGDGESKFTIIYTLIDRFGNPSPNSPLYIHTSIDGEERNVYTNEDGCAILTYGPKTSIGRVLFSADSVSNPAVRDDVELLFTSSDGTWFEAYANPSNIPSFEVKPFNNGTIYAQVTDDLGRGVEGEKISFAINTSSIENDTLMIADPMLYDPVSGWGDSATNILTDEDGYALVTFRSGEFPDKTSADFNPYSSGSCTVTVTWDKSGSPEIKETQTISWRNYPYLSAETEVSNPNIRPGEEFDVTIRLIGDGFELSQHKPVDVVLLLDRGEDMLLSEDGQDRMELARDAAYRLLYDPVYSTGLTPGTDRVAFIPYGDKTDNPPYTGNIANILRTADGGPLDTTYQWSKDVGQDGNKHDDGTYIAHYGGNGEIQYLDYAEVKLDYNLSVYDWGDYHNALWDTVPLQKYATGQASAPLRKGLYEAITYMKNDPPADSETVKAIVLLMQNNYRYFGDPFAEGGVMSVAPYDNTLAKGGSDYYPFGLSAANENMVNYAIENDITIYAIYYPSGGSASDEEVPRRLAEETGGEYFFAADANALKDAFDAIREKLMKEAGVNTQMDIKLINNVESLNWTAEEILTYIPHNPNSTSIDYYNWTVDPLTPFLGVHHAGYPLWEDRTSDWLEDNNFYYSVGNISIKETWETTFTMQVNSSINETLNFSLFDEDSSITFTNQDDNTTIALPTQHMQVSPNLTADVMEAVVLQLWNLREIAQTPEYREFAWDINYTGEADLVERVEYRPEDGGYILADWEPNLPASTTSDTVKIMTENLPRMDYYLRVTVNSNDAGVKKAILQFSLSEPEKPYIRIQ